MNRGQHLLKTMGIASGLSLCTLAAGGAPPSERPNILWITCEDMWPSIGCYGDGYAKTPNLDRFAEESVRYRHAFATAPVCTPSRAALLTGCYPKRVGMHQHVLFPSSKKGLNPDEHTIADHLKSQGYATACFGKWHLGRTEGRFPTDQGFDEWYGYLCQRQAHSYYPDHLWENGKKVTLDGETWTNFFELLETAE